MYNVQCTMYNVHLRISPSYQSTALNKLCIIMLCTRVCMHCSRSINSRTTTSRSINSRTTTSRSINPR